jgi:uncharacterized membrane protein YeaQ/YmgE (transglycosylase-associated protein family)
MMKPKPAKASQGDLKMDNNIGYWFWILLIGGIIGWLAGLIVKGRGFGILGDIVVGIVGAIFGGWLFGALGISTYGSSGAFLTALVGAVILVALTRLFRLAA